MAIEDLARELSGPGDDADMEKAAELHTRVVESAAEHGDELVQRAGLTHRAAGDVEPAQLVEALSDLMADDELRYLTYLLAKSIPEVAAARSELGDSDRQRLDQLQAAMQEAASLQAMHEVLDQHRPPAGEAEEMHKGIDYAHAILNDGETSIYSSTASKLVLLDADSQEGATPTATPQAGRPVGQPAGPAATRGAGSVVLDIAKSDTEGAVAGAATGAVFAGVGAVPAAATGAVAGSVANVARHVLDKLVPGR